MPAPRLKHKRISRLITPPTPESHATSKNITTAQRQPAYRIRQAALHRIKVDSRLFSLIALPLPSAQAEASASGPLATALDALAVQARI